jgi:hypothetical protein
MILDIIGQPYTTQLSVGTHNLLKEGCPIMSSFPLGEPRQRRIRYPVVKKGTKNPKQRLKKSA